MWKKSLSYLLVRVIACPDNALETIATMYSFSLEFDGKKCAVRHLVVDSNKVAGLGAVPRQLTQGGSALGDEERAFIARSEAFCKKVLLPHLCICTHANAFTADSLCEGISLAGLIHSSWQRVLEVARMEAAAVTAIIEGARLAS